MLKQRSSKLLELCLTPIPSPTPPTPSLLPPPPLHVPLYGESTVVTVDLPYVIADFSFRFHLTKKSAWIAARDERCRRR